VRVALSGQGADECLTGYRGALPLLYAELLRRGPGALLAALLPSLPAEGGLSWLLAGLRLYARRRLPTGLQRAWLSLRWQAAFADNRYFRLSELGPAPPPPPPLPHAEAFAERSYLHGYLYSLLCGSSLGTILRYEDRNSMYA